MNNVSKNGYRDLPLCDTHFHLIYPHTVENTAKIFCEIMEYFGISRITMLGINCASGHRKIDFPNNIKGLYVREILNSKKENSAYVYGSLAHMFDGSDTADSYLSQVKEMYDIGFDGVKMLEGKPEFRKKLGHPLCDSLFDKAFSFMEENGFPVKMHLADPYTGWGPKENVSPYALSRGWWYGDGTYPSFEQLHGEVYEIMRKHPKLKLCLAHFFYLGHRPDEIRAFFDKYENVSVDLTPGASMFKGFTENYDNAVKLFRDYSDRIFFGSDTYNNEVSGDAPDKYEQSGDAGHRINLVRTCLEKSKDTPVKEGNLGILKPLELPESVLRNIYFDNHVKLHPEPRKVNRVLAKAHALRLLDIINQPFHDYGDPGELLLETENLRKIIAYFD